MKKIVMSATIAGAVCAVVFSADSQKQATTSRTIPQGAIFIWTGTNASIPAGWSRVTALDSTYPKGAAASTNPNGTGGAATHTHSSTSHTHTGAAHTHTITVGTGYGTEIDHGDGSSIARLAHSHPNFTSGAVSGFSASSVAATYASMSNDPPYHNVIYITPTEAITGGLLPAGVVGLADTDEMAGFDVCDGTNGTPNLAGDYLKGASSGGNAGGTGGSTTNIHALSHTHTTTHGHAAATSGTTATTAGSTAGSGNIEITHTHSIALPAATPSTEDTVSLTTTETVEPAYTKLLAVTNSAETTIPKDMIALWLESLDSIPDGWTVCDGGGGTVDMRGRHLKIAATAGEVGDTGGSNTHAHASQTHSHAVAHTHGTTITHSGLSSRGDTSGSAACTTPATAHDIGTTSVNLVLNSASTSAAGSGNEPPYRTVAFIKFTNAPPEDFSLLAPSDQTATNDNTPAFAWEASADPESQPVTYTLKLSLTAGFTEPVYRTVTGLGDASYTPAGGQEIAEGSYYWKVIASDGVMQTESAQTRQLTVDTQVPVVPVITTFYPDLDTGKITKIYGRGEDGTTLTLYDGNDNTIAGSTQWDGSGHFTFTPATPLEPGSSVYANSRDSAANTSRSRAHVIIFQDLVDIFAADDVYHGSSPGTSVRLEKNTTYSVASAVNGGTPVSIRAWVRKNPAYAGAPPSITLTGPGIDGTGAATASMTAGADTWEQLTVTGTPDARGVVTLTVGTSSTADGAKTWVDDIAVSQ